MGLIVGIDPDDKKSGLAVFQNNTMELHALGIVPLTVWLSKHAEDIDLVYLEAGWLNKSLHHRIKSVNQKYQGKIGRDVGVNNGYGKVIEQFLQHNNIPYKLVKPTKQSQKVGTFPFKKLTGYTKRINQDVRDAAMLVIRAERDKVLKGITAQMIALKILKVR